MNDFIAGAFLGALLGVVVGVLFGLILKGYADNVLMLLKEFKAEGKKDKWLK